jgi:transaldolase
MRKAGIQSYSLFVVEALKRTMGKPISFEILADDPKTMISQGLKLASMGENIFVKIPIVNSEGNTSYEVIETLLQSKIHLNITAIMTKNQVDALLPLLENGGEIYLSVFAGRIADTGIDPEEIVEAIALSVANYPGVKVLWASPREILNILHAIRSKSRAITLTQDILSKRSLLGKNLDEYSKETSKMFLEDAQSAGLSI